jgi:hypothetical protein
MHNTEETVETVETVKTVEDKKKSYRNAIISVFLVVVMFFAGFSIPKIYAYLTDGDKATNEFVIAKQTIEVLEPDYTPPKELYPGVSFPKNPMVKNTGTTACYVRMLAEVSTSDMGQYLEIDYNTTNWTEKQEDGYYYYKEILEPGETTEPLFTTVKVMDSAPADQMQDFEIIIYSESVQSRGYSSASEAWADMTAQ